MVEQDLSPFQRYFNSLTFYLFLLGVKYKHLEDYDEDGPFNNHYKTFFQIKSKLNEKIFDDDRLLININPFNEYFGSISKMDLKRSDVLRKIKKINRNSKYNKDEISKLYFKLSNTLPKSKIRSNAIQFISWSFPTFIFSLLLFVFFMAFSKSLIDLIFPTFIFLFAILLFISGFEKLIALRKSRITNFKFKNLFSSDYCYRRIKESEKFFFEVYKINNDYFDISYIDTKYPEIGNLFERTIKESKTSDSNKEKLLIQNKNPYVRAVFSDFFELLSKEGISQFQQAAFMFEATLKRANLPVQGNTGFAECVNLIVNKNIFSDTTFNQAKAKYKNEEDLFDKYRNILKKFENILQ